MRFLVFLNNGQGGLVAKRRRAPWCERHEPAIQISEFAQEGQSHGGVVAQLADLETMLLIPQSLHSSISQIDHPQRSANLLLRVQHGKVLQRGAIHNHIHRLPPPIWGNKGDAATLRFCCNRLLRSHETFLMINCHFSRHFSTSSNWEWNNSKRLHHVNGVTWRERWFYRARGRGGERPATQFRTKQTGFLANAPRRFLWFCLFFGKFGFGRLSESDFGKEVNIRCQKEGDGF